MFKKHQWVCSSTHGTPSRTNQAFYGILLTSMVLLFVVTQGALYKATFILESFQDLSKDWSKIEFLLFALAI